MRRPLSSFLFLAALVLLIGGIVFVIRRGSDEPDRTRDEADSVKRPDGTRPSEKRPSSSTSLHKPERRPTSKEGIRTNGKLVRARDALLKAIRDAQPGDRILVAPGTYSGPGNRVVCYIGEKHGKPGKLIELLAQDPNNPPVFKGGKVGLYLSRCSYFLVDGIIATGQTVNDVQVDFSHHILLRRVHTKDINNGGNADGIKMPGVTDFLIYDCTIESWGGNGSAIDMVGCARGLVARTLFRYPNLKGASANAVQPKGGTHDLGVYKCRFDQASLRAVQFGGSTGAKYFHQKNREQGFEAYDQVAMGNVISGGGSAVAFVSCRRCVFSYNTIVNPERYVLRVLKEGGTKPTSENTFSRNLIIHGPLSQVMNSGGQVDVASFTFAENWWFNRSNPGASIPKLPKAKQLSPVGGSDPRLRDDLSPAETRAMDYGAHAKGLATAWKPHTARFEWAWKWAQKFEGSTSP